MVRNPLYARLARCKGEHYSSAKGGPVNSKGGNSETTTEHHASGTFHDQVPCVGTGEITVTYKEVDHTTDTGCSICGGMRSGSIICGS
jgi:hypothetical protein